ncbi:hypothetical protein HYU15_02690 [Candidatus Woesearchaeota archaeon]|nr:hypothetical protein [Candidatus Woesearchaeota archaeon]
MNAPVFVKVERYKRAAAVIDRVKKRLDDAKSVIKRLNELKFQEEHELKEWQAELENIGKKLSYIEGSLSRPDER